VVFGVGFLGGTFFSVRNIAGRAPGLMSKRQAALSVLVFGALSFMWFWAHLGGLRNEAIGPSVLVVFHSGLFVIFCVLTIRAMSKSGKRNRPDGNVQK